MRVTRWRTRAADQDPRPESVGILRAVSAAASASADVTPLARSLVRMARPIRPCLEAPKSLGQGFQSWCLTSLPAVVLA